MASHGGTIAQCGRARSPTTTCGRHARMCRVRPCSRCSDGGASARRIGLWDVPRVRRSGRRCFCVCSLFLLTCFPGAQVGWGVGQLDAFSDSWHGLHFEPCGFATLAEWVEGLAVSGLRVVGGEWLCLFAAHVSPRKSSGVGMWGSGILPVCPLRRSTLLQPRSSWSRIWVVGPPACAGIALPSLIRRWRPTPPAAVVIREGLCARVPARAVRALERCRARACDAVGEERLVKGRFRDCV